MQKVIWEAARNPNEASKVYRDPMGVWHLGTTAYNALCRDVARRAGSIMAGTLVPASDSPTHRYVQIIFFPSLRQLLA